jgi:hypothetical protein
MGFALHLSQSSEVRHQPVLDIAWQIGITNMSLNDPFLLFEVMHLISYHS